MSLIIHAKDVGKQFAQTTAIASFSMEISRGQCVGLLGPNGAGKSTFIGMLYGVIRRTAGTLMVFDQDPNTHASAIKERLGVVPQENCLDEDLTVMRNMLIYADFLGIPRASRTDRILELLTHFKLEHKENAAIRSLSGGMKRRLAFVRALLGNPELLILDEPTTGLDPAVRHLLWNKVSELKSKGTTILVTTHYMHEAEALCDKVMILNNGSLQTQGSPQSLVDEHTPGYVAQVQARHLPRSAQAALPQEWPIRSMGDSFWIRAPRLSDLASWKDQHQVDIELLRPANLEDVFLKLTGQDLNHDA